ncbi:MAG: competence damage-inducible protein A [Candidatus Bathyarchaeota archaeon]|nr:MAG: competence damage-inducible protein A [Candidatus Bathyarchaeota archaeon]
MPCTVELVSVGNELLIGKVSNTNAQWLAERVTSLRGRMIRAVLVRDEISEIVEAIRSTLDRHPDFILTTGGLGPTFDDMTLEGIAHALGRPLELNDKALQMIERRGRRLVAEGRRKEFNLTDPMKKMAFLPREAIPLQNPQGSAPGVLLEFGKTRIIAMPGVPHEMKAIFSEYVEPLIIEMSSNLNYFEKSLVVKGLGESSLSPYVDQVMTEFPEVYIKSHPRRSELLGRFIELHMSALCENPIDARSIVEKASLLVFNLISQGGAIVREANEEDVRR